MTALNRSQPTTHTSPRGLGQRVAGGLGRAAPLLLVAAGSAVLMLSRLGAFEFDPDEGSYRMWARLVRDGYRMYRDIWIDHPPLIMLTLAGAFGVWGESVEVARVIAVVVSVIGLLAVGGITWLAAGRWAGVAAAVILALAPLFNWYGQAVMPDAPATSLAALALLLAIKAPDREHGGWRWAGVAGLVFGASLMVKLVTLPLAPVYVAGLYVWRGGWRTVTSLVLAWGIGVLAAVALTFSRQDVISAAQTIVSVMRDARAAQPWNLTETWRVIQAVVQEGHLGLLPLAALGGVACLVGRKREGFIILLWAAVAILAILTHTPLFDHHLALALLPLAVLGGIGVAQARRGWGWRLAVVVALGVYAWQAPTAWEVAQHEPGDREAQSWQTLDDVRAVTQPGEWMMADNPVVPFRAGLSVPPYVAYAGSKRLIAGYLPDEVMVQQTAQARPKAILFIRRAEQELRGAYLNWVDHTYELRHYYGATRRLWVPFAGGPMVALDSQPVTNEVSFEGYSLAQPAVRRGHDVRLGLFWRSGQPLGDKYAMRVGLVAPDGRVVARHDGPPTNGTPESLRGVRGDWTLDLRALRPPPDAPLGKYSLEVALVGREDGQPVGAVIRLPDVVDVTS